MINRKLVLTYAVLIVTAVATMSSLPSVAAEHRSGPTCTQLPNSGTTADSASGSDTTDRTVSFHADQDVCVEAHVYEVVQVADGTRFLDVCPTETPDDQCRFIVLSLPADRGTVGDLTRYRDQTIRLRGTLRPMRGRLGIVISHVRQFSGGPEKFRPNPRLVKGFNGQTSSEPVHDPNLRGGGRRRSFMDTREQEPLSTSQKR